jgi:hypothetical protein
VRASDAGGNGNARLPRTIASFEPSRSNSFESSEPAAILDFAGPIIVGNPLYQIPDMPADARPFVSPQAGEGWGAAAIIPSLR